MRIIGSQGGQLAAALLRDAAVGDPQRRQRASGSLPPISRRPIRRARRCARAARRGVDVRLLLPSHSDSSPALAAQHSHYARLLRAGVKIYEREDGILHSKTVVADGVWSIVGSSNFDHRSVLFNDEVDAVVIGAAPARSWRATFSRTCSTRSRHRSGDLGAAPVSRKLREHFWRLWEQLL